MSDNLSLILVMGGPGAGKSTVSNIIQNTVKDSIHLKTGQIVRNIVITESSMDSLTKEEVNKVMKLGGLVKDDIVCEFLEKEISSLSLKKVANKFILDGFPRTISQLRCLLSNSHLKIKMAFILTAPHSIMEKRCKMRNLRTDRVDDRKAPVENRINEFLHHIPDIEAQLKSLNVKIVDIDTCDSMAEMKTKIEKSVKELS